MGAFFEVIVNFINAIIGVVSNLISGFVQMVIMVPNSITFLTYTIGFIPGVIAVTITALITVNVVYLFIGR